MVLLPQPCGATCTEWKSGTMVPSQGGVFWLVGTSLLHGCTKQALSVLISVICSMYNTLLHSTGEYRHIFESDDVLFNIVSMNMCASNMYWYIYCVVSNHILYFSNHIHWKCGRSAGLQPWWCTDMFKSWSNTVYYVLDIHRFLFTVVKGHI